MTFSVPSFFAAATRASMPPKPAAVVALAAFWPEPPAAALAPDDALVELLLDEQAVALRVRTTAMAAMPVRRRFTVSSRTGRPGVGRDHPRQGLCGCQVDGNSESGEHIEVVWPTPSCLANY